MCGIIFIGNLALGLGCTDVAQCVGTNVECSDDTCSCKTNYIEVKSSCLQGQYCVVECFTVNIWVFME